MSNLRLSSSVNATPPVNAPSATPQTAPTTPSAVPTKTAEDAKKVYQTEGNQLGNQQLVGGGQEQGIIENVIDHAEPQTLQHQARLVPDIEALSAAKAELKPTATVDKTTLSHFGAREVQQDNLAAKSSHVETKAVDAVHQKMTDEQLGAALKQLEPARLGEDKSRLAVSIQRARHQVSAQLQQGLTGAAEAYDHKTQALMGSKTSKSGEAALGDQVKQWIQNQGRDSDLVQTLVSMSPAEVEEVATTLLKDIKGYRDKDMQSLSARKQAFVRVVSENLQAGARSAIPGSAGNPHSIQDNLKHIQQSYGQMVQDAGGMNSQVGRELMLRSDGEVLAALNTQENQSNVLLNQVMLAGFNQGLGGSVSANRVAPQGKESLQVPEQIQINGKTYGQPKYLAAGGFADIIAYTNPNNAHDKVVLKQLKNDDDKPQLALRQEAAEELLNQIEIEGNGGHPNINALTGAIRGDNDQLYIIQDMADGGSLSGVKSKMWALHDNGILPTEVKQLLATHLMKGLLQGMDHIQNERQGHHFDLKLPNVLLGSDGEAKITDFGFSGLGTSRHVSKLDGNDNPIYQSPEMVEGVSRQGIKARIDQQIQEEGLDTFHDTTVRSLSPTEKEHFGRIKAEQGQEAVDAALAERDQKKEAYVQRYQELLTSAPALQVSSRADTWNAGVAALELFKLRHPSDHKIYDENFSSKIGDNVKAFGENYDNRMASASPMGGEDGEMGMGITAVDKLINGLMHPDPEQRTNFKAALNNSLFADERLDKPEVGQLLLKVSKVDPAALSAADRAEIQRLVSALQ